MRRHAPATDRNRDPIADILADDLPDAGLVLEIASGTGQHCAWFAQRFPQLVWQPTDPDLESLVSIADWCADIANVLPPVGLDASADEWPVGRADAILCVNMVHISPWAATLGLMAGAGQLLDAGAPLILYGPYRQRDVPTAPSNEAFDLSLKARNPDYGLRHVEDVARVAADNRLTLRRIVSMPANNLMLVFRRDA
ncbi:DUF938 domain-containing protein [Sphingomonas sp. HF-S3]|uniref:DUF938 domain-containing protein n=1 Tax=Sphingomonas rustica TaxID=3103142 RepID=A0ABV0BCV3_9SPHN